MDRMSGHMSAYVTIFAIVETISFGNDQLLFSLVCGFLLATAAEEYCWQLLSMLLH